MTDLGIVGAGAYVPYWRLKRSMIAEAWGIPSIPGERVAASADEDALTMATEAALVASEHINSKKIDGVIFASTTAPYREKQSATTIATVLDCRRDVFTLDIADTLRGATTGLRVAADAIRAGSAAAVLVCAADIRIGEPETRYELTFGDAAGAVLLASAEWAESNGFEGLPVLLEDVVGVSVESIGPWRRDTDHYVRSFESKIEVKYGTQQAIDAARALLERADIAPDEVDRAIVAAPEPRAQQEVVKTLGLGGALVQDLYFKDIGSMGTPAPLVMLVGALEEAASGERILLTGAGDGADAMLLRTSDELRHLRDAARWGRLTPFRESKGYLSSYATYAADRKLVEREPTEVWSSSVTYWRDVPMELPFYGMTCRECRTVQFPIGKRCVECSAIGPHESKRLTRRGQVFTFTLDHLVQGEYRNEPVPRAVIDLDGGARVFCEVTDCKPNDIRIEMPVELTFRCMHDGARFRNYYWKARPVRVGMSDVVR